MHTIPQAHGPHVSLNALLDEFSVSCLATKGRLRRLNRYLFGVDLILSVTPAPMKPIVEQRLLDIALDCGLLESLEIKQKVQTL